MTVLVSVDGKPLKMEVDTGASLTVIPNNVWKEVLASKPLRDTTVKLKSYSGHEIPVKGEVDVRVVYGNQKAYLPMIVTESEGPILLGRLPFGVAASPAIFQKTMDVVMSGLKGVDILDDVPEQLRFYHTKQDEFTIEDGCLLR